MKVLFVDISLNPSEDGSYSYYAFINVLDDDSLSRYASRIGADPERLKDPVRFSAIVIDHVTYFDEQNGKYTEVRNINIGVGERLEMEYFDRESGITEGLLPLEVAALAEDLPMGVSNNDPRTLCVIISRDVYDRLVEGHPELSENTETRFYMRSDEPERLQEALEDYRKGMETEITLYSLYEYRKKQEQIIFLMSVFTYGFMALITAVCIANILNTITTSFALRKREFAMLKSVGMTPGSFSRMIYYESLFYGVKALLISLPVSLFVMYLIFNVLGGMYSYAFTVPWKSISVAIVSVFVIVGVAMLYSGSRAKRENIIDVLNQEII